MSTITREQLHERAREKVKSLEFAVTQTAFADSRAELEEELELARIALASLEAEAVCVIDQSNLDYLKSGADADVWPASRKEMGDVLLYRSAPPAPVSVPEWTNEQCLEFLSIAFRHAEIKGDLELDDIRLGVKMVNGSRAAMLQGADVSLTHEGKNHHEDKLGMVNHLGDVTEKVEPVTQIEPVADLYGLTSPTGSETSFTFDAVEARDFVDGGWSCQEYVELERFQEAITNHTEDKLAMVDHSGDSNNMVEPVTTANKLPFDQWLSQQTGTIDVECGCVMTEVFFHWLRVAYEAGNYPVIPDGWVLVPEEPTHEMLEAGDEQFGTYDVYRRMIAAAPQQEA